MGVPVEAQGWLSRHQQAAWRDKAPRVVTFEYFNGEKVVRSESYLVDADGDSHLLPEVHPTRWRYLITVFEPTGN